MSEYQICSVYFSRKNKLLLLICVFFFSCSTHIFKNVFPFLFMLTGVRNEIDIDNVVHQGGNYPPRESQVGGATKGEGVKINLFEASAAFPFVNKPPGGSAVPPSMTVSQEAMQQNPTHMETNATYVETNPTYVETNATYAETNATYAETKDRNSQSIYLYSNILSLIYCSSLVTYIFILIFDLGKKNYVVNSFYIVNLVSHFIIFLLLSDIQMRNTDLHVVTSGVDTSWVDTSMSRRAMSPVAGLSLGSYSNQKRTISSNDVFAKRRDLNFYFKKNLQERLNSWEFLSVGLLHKSAVECVLMNGPTGGSEAGNAEGGNGQGGKDKQSSDRDAAYTYERKYLKFLYLFIIISSICSGYIKIYQKRIMYCIFYVNIGVITSLLILMNSLFKLFAHSLNYVVTSNNSNTDISDYIILFLVIDMFGLLMILVFTYKWFYQQNLWTNMHKIFYNYKYVCFYHKETYYLYSVDKNIDNILVHIDMCKDENVKISFCAYMNLKKSIFYDYFRLNTFRKNKLRILEIADKNLEVKSTYKVMDNSHGETDMTPRGVYGERGQRGHLGQRGELGDQLCSPSFSRKQNHSYTMKPYKICIESLGSLANSGPRGDNDLCEGTTDANQLAASQLAASQTDEEDQGQLHTNDAGGHVGSVQTEERRGGIPNCVKKQRRRLAKGDSVHFVDPPYGEAAYADAEEHSHLPHHQYTKDRAHEGGEMNIATDEDLVDSEKFCWEEENADPQESEEQSRNVLLIPNYDDDCNRSVDYYDDWDLPEEMDEAGSCFLSRVDERNGRVKNKILSIYKGIQKFSSSFTFYFFFFIFIYAFLLSIMHIFINYFFYIYLFVFNINIYVSNVYTIIMTFVSLIAIPFSGYIVDNIGSFLSLLLCSSSFILVAISGSIYCYKFNLNSEALAFLFFNLIGISESIIPTVIISQIPTHLCVKNNEDITSAFAFFELVTMIIISLNNYVFGCFLIKEEYLKGLYVLFFFVILVISLILSLIVTIYLKKKRNARAYKSPRNADLAQPLL
ncbi:hypothetical protein AK88_04231 [Plasmodium fragile]|uniref:Uncharacterized protein n=2 Tax=Plasmodium fragile TaxID=5857 RepID=A0A0D9QGM6_PLAFR|nr:uncharacterized protein AK88_04231 [Plasmodium fragile]KJP86108.1 hypothetical protein AK88_04231 [Plasmodium fragile]